MIAPPILSTNQFSGVPAVDVGHEPIRPPTISRLVKITNPHGLHLRRCLDIVRTAERHQAVVVVQKGTRSANAASILELLLLAAPLGTDLLVSATGAEAMDALVAVAGLLARATE